MMPWWKDTKPTLRLANPSPYDDSGAQDGPLSAQLPTPVYHEALRDTRIEDVHSLSPTAMWSIETTTLSSPSRRGTSTSSPTAYIHWRDRWSSIPFEWPEPERGRIERPPDYGEVRSPLNTMTYQFSNLPGGGTLLLPPETAPNTRPVYHIRTFQNTFAPLSHRTTVHRGSSDQGEFVGEFEFGMSANDSYILLHKKALPLPQVLYKAQKPQGSVSYTINGKWIWNWPRTPVPLYWTCIDRSEAWICELKNKTRLAEYVPPHLSPSRGMTLPTLEVMLAGQNYFDDILFGAIILEQKNSMPSFTVVNRAFCSKELYNF